MQDREEETGSPVPGESAEETHFQPQTAAPAVDKRRPHRRARRDLERLSREVERWHALHQAAAVVSGVRGEQEVYDTTTHSLSRLGFAAAVFAFDQRTQSLAVVSAAAASARLLRAVERLAGAPLVGFAFPLSKFDFYRKVIQRGESRFVELGSRHLAELLPETLSFLAGRLAARARLDYGIAVPLKAQGQTVAVLLVAGDDLTPDDVPVVTAFGDQTSTALENARLIEAERRQRQVAETLRRVTLLINASLDVDTVLDRILEQLSQVVEYDSTSLMLVESDQLVMRALRGFEEPEHVLAITYQVAENALFQEMLATRRPIVIPDVKADDRYVRWPGSTPVRSWIGVPLMVRGEIIGQLAVDKQQPNFYTQEDAELALAFAQQVAIAIENAQLFDSERRQREIAESLQEVAAVLNASLDLDTVLAGILEHLRRVVDYDSAGLLLQDGDDLLISDGVGLLEPGTVIGQRIPLSSDDPAVRVFKERCTLVIDDVQADPNWINVAGDHWIRGWIGAPLMAGAEPIGVLTVDSLRVGSYSREDADVVRSFAAHAAVAIENARLFEAEQRQRHMAEALHRAALALTSTMALDQVFDRILTELQHVVPTTAHRYNC
jgi:GAF domain-containing protein